MTTLFAAVLATTVASLGGPGWTADGVSVSVPHCWNIEDGTDGKGVLSSERYAKNSSCSSSYERKRVIYRCALPDPTPGKRQFVRFRGASIFAEVFVNGAKVGSHLGAFTAFCFEVTEKMRPTGNVLEAAVDNFVHDDSPPVNADFTMYGGLCRDVEWIETDPVCIDRVTDGAEGVVLDADPASGVVTARVSVLGGTNEIQRFRFENPELWSPESPRLYTVNVVVAQRGSRDVLPVTFGFRTVEFRQDGFYLNGVRRRLRGVNCHQDREGRGWAVSAAEREADFRAIRELGADAVRTAHYPHDDAAYALCDRLGLLAFCEQPNVNGLRFTDAFRSNVWRQTREMVMQLRNHPSIFVWSIFNELYNKVPMTEGEPEAMMADLRDCVAALDPSRKVAGVGSFPRKTLLNAVPQVLGVNRYPLWYDENHTMGQLVDELFACNRRTTLAITEYGAGGSFGQHALATAPVNPYGDSHPVEFQAYLHALDWRDLKRDDRLWGTFVWTMFDYGSDCRLEGAHHGWNDKGLVTYDRRNRKDAWYLYKAEWTKEPVLHLVGPEFLGTTNAAAAFLAFSNVGAVTLKLNGRVADRKMPEAGSVLFERVPLVRGSNVVEVAAGGLSARAVVFRAPACNYDPAKVGACPLAEPTMPRAEILDYFQREMYGRIPGAPETLELEVFDEGTTMGGYATRRQVSMWFRRDRTGPRIDWLLLLPRQAKAPAPAILFLNYGGNHELLGDSSIRVPDCWLKPAPGFGRFGERATAATRGLYADHSLRTVYPVGMMLARGFAVATACYGEVSPDPYERVLDGRYRPDDVLSLFPYDAARGDNPTALGAWAWALMRGLDLLTREPAVDASRVTVCGSSRLGKAALLAGAFDARFYAVVPNQTGGGGVPLMSRNYGESAETLLAAFPHWFCRNFRKWAGREKERAMDQHCLLACVAPRKLLVEGFSDPFYDPEGEYLAVRAASKAWTVRGLEGLPEGSFPAPYDTSAIGPNVGYVRRTERHGFAAIDWMWLMDFCR